MPGTVRRRMFHGDFVQYVVDCPLGQMIVRHPPTNLVAEGEGVESILFAGALRPAQRLSGPSWVDEGPVSNGRRCRQRRSGASSAAHHRDNRRSPCAWCSDCPRSPHRPRRQRWRYWYFCPVACAVSSSSNASLSLALEPNNPFHAIGVQVEGPASGFWMRANQGVYGIRHRCHGGRG